MALHILLHISIFLLMCTAKAIDSEAEALLRWRSTLIGAKSVSSWSMANSTCSWSGVTCDAAGHVTRLKLPYAGLSGTLDAFYSEAFRNLISINLGNNNLVGNIPANISLLHTLTFLNLRSNNLVGAIPYQLSHLTSIVGLNLGNNHLTIPEYAKFTPMPNLKFLFLYHNDLNGTFPQYILNCTYSLPEIVPRLRYLDLSANGFSGSIPRSLSRLQKLEVLYLEGNNLTGGIPEELGKITVLE
ncbi:hypothetical protein BRADI_1g37565v3 [Brachypodium distachyon]|uniref:Leucine-rich repeat-containing N-terminal plant-type domain-containing protein n=1 Tax=Brachypodium distachyon TaxID=15368 RepID=A0A2K2DN84_BRADI|nr:hypothetical protein BRADI_1g37565v3 [Brachypodium distachyon]PNT75730.1 hypothetical protein BRADI_1g37565v3 [Brachypodium distachyon]PNT75731.1 hypothetical protein BRADI_1g37565v3 [Brachypodium distachyon]PNT75732.1 hypothetical protein BRADI_1g37565v3 [Brachypodium distachyon]PNT75733.1 hypothetical protein BRADI_1g37565v3 [Brachypodium distachyon]